MSEVIQPYRFLSALSLDVVAGALACSLFFSRIFSVALRPPELIALGLSVWIIYTADHLRDSRNIQQRASTERHQFHQLHYRTLFAVMSVMVILDAIAILFIPRQVLIWGIVLSAAVFVYLFTHRLLRFLKEVFIATLYASGIVLPSLAVSTIEINEVHYLLIFHFTVLALTNLLMFSWFDRDVDLRDSRHSFATIAGESVTRIAIWFLCGIQILTTLVELRIGYYTSAAILLCIMGLLLTVIFIFRKSLAPHEYYRFLGDAVFIVPVLYLI